MFSLQWAEQWKGGVPRISARLDELLLGDSRDPRRARQPQRDFLGIIDRLLGLGHGQNRLLGKCSRL